MNKREYDIVYLTNTPSFYKLALCNEIAKHKSVLLVFYGFAGEAVNKELTGIDWRFDYEFLYKGTTTDRSKFKTFLNLIRLFRRIKAKKVLYSGWCTPEYNLFGLFYPKSKNVIVCESSILDVDLARWKGLIKKFFIRRMSAALPSGKLHDELFKKIGFKGKCYITGSVGIINKPGRSLSTSKNRPLRFLYVGRLVDCKNLGFLIDVFNENGRPLTIVGVGELESQLKSKAKKNIQFTGFVPNEELGSIYKNHDVFILPSKSETWGLVVEEAIYWGLPVIVSDRVGCGQDMVSDLNTGQIFQLSIPNSLNDKINEIEMDYDIYKDAVLRVDFTERDKQQVNAYLQLIEK